MDWLLYLAIGFCSILFFVAFIAALIGLMALANWIRARKYRKMQRLQVEDDAAIHARLVALVARGWFCWWCESRQPGPPSPDGFCSDLCADDYARYCEELAG